MNVETSSSVGKPSERQNLNTLSDQGEFPGIHYRPTEPPPPIIGEPIEIIPPHQGYFSKPAFKSLLPFNIPNMGEVKNFVEKMGGIDGVIDKMGKFQKFMSSAQQMAPMVKLFFTKGKKKSAGTKTKSTRIKRRRPRRRRPLTLTSKRPKR